MTNDSQSDQAKPEATSATAQDLDRTSRYIARRLDPQLAYFESAAAKAKRSHQGLVATQLVATASIPIANALPGSSFFTTVLACAAAVATGLVAVYGHQENWIRYRRNASALETLKARYEHGLAPFNGADRDEHFAEEVEKILSGEGDQWTKQIQASSASAKKPAPPTEKKAPQKDDSD